MRKENREQRAEDKRWNGLEGIRGERRGLFESSGLRTRARKGDGDRNDEDQEERGERKLGRGSDTIAQNIEDRAARAKGRPEIEAEEAADVAAILCEEWLVKAHRRPDALERSRIGVGAQGGASGVGGEEISQDKHGGDDGPGDDEGAEQAGGEEADPGFHESERERERRRPSPSKPKPSEKRTSARPGAVVIHGALRSCACPSASIRPQAGNGAGAPRPRNASVDSARIIWGTNKAPSTMMSEDKPGKMCLTAI